MLNPEDDLYFDEGYNDEDDYLDDEGVEIHSEVFDKDFDDVNFEGEVDDDSDEEAAEFFDY